MLYQLLIGETVLVHDQQRECHVGPTTLVTGTELFGQMRRRVHRNWRTEQDLRMPGVLRDATVQRFQRVRPARVATVSPLSVVSVFALERGWHRNRQSAEMFFFPGSKNENNSQISNRTRGGVIFFQIKS